METQKIVNLLGDADNESSKFAVRKWYVINDQNNTDYGEGNEDGTTAKLETKVIKSNICDYSDAYILVKGDITATGSDSNTKVTFKKCAPFIKCNCNIHLELNWSRDCVISTIADTTFEITNKIIHSNCYFIKQGQYKTGKTIRRRI